MKYKNKKTGAIIYSSCEIKGKDWEEIKEEKKSKKVKKDE